ncbi:3'-5' exonuclease, partial [Oryza sativa Japonica Group]
PEVNRQSDLGQFEGLNLKTPKAERDLSTSIVNDFGDGTYTVAFDEDKIYTTVTDSGEEVEEWLDEIVRIHHRRLDHLIVGLDVEWNPASGFCALGPVAVLQICVGRRCLVFQIIHADYVPDQLGDFLGDGRFTFVGVGIHDDVDKLREHYDLEVENAVDLRYLAAQTIGKPALRSTGLQGLVWEVMDVWMEKPHHVRVSAWDSRQLTLDQVMYACADAFASFEVGRSLYDDYE